MAVNPNFTNANAFTPYASGGGGSNFPLGITFPPVGILRTDGFFSASPNSLYFVDNSGVEARFVANPLAAGTYTGGFLEVRPADMVAYQPLTGTSKLLLTINQSTLSNATPSFNLLNLSTLQTGSYTANATALFSSLQGTFPTSFQ